MCKKLLLSVATAVALLATSQVFAEGQFIDIYPKTEADIKLVINTLEERIANHSASDAPPILLMLHGKEAKRFLRSEYSQNKSLIDATAKLAGFGVLEVKICETWMRKNMHGEEELRIRRIALDLLDVFEGFIEHVHGGTQVKHGDVLAFLGGVHHR